MSTTATSSDSTAWQACLLAIVGGWADAVGFLTFNAFAGAMTGNTVLLGIALAHERMADAAQSAAIIAAFLLGVTASLLMRRIVPLAAIVIVEIAAIVVAALVAPLAAALVLAFAMGLQNAAITRFAGSSLNTVFLTGNLQKLVQTLLGNEWRKSSAEGVAVRLLASFWLSYLLGIVLGAAAWKWTAHPLLPAVLPLSLVLLRPAQWRSDG